MEAKQEPARPWADLRPLTPAEVQRYVACRYGGRPDPVLVHRYLHDPEYHARVHLWELSRESGQ
jgi:hypothetical protein